MRSHVISSDAFSRVRGSTRRRRRYHLGMMVGAIASLAVAVLTFAAANAPDRPEQEAVAVATPVALPPAVWIDILHPIELFDLTAPELAKSPLVYVARRNRLGGGRQDILTFGRFSGSSLYLRLQLYRVGMEAAPTMPLYVDFARSAAQAGLSIARSATAAAMPTRFGAFEVADIALAGEDRAERQCLGFRGSALAGEFRILGFACGSEAEPPAWPALACLLDRFDLNAAGEDHQLAAFFAASELQRNPACAGTRLAPTKSRASWLDRHDAPPQLKAKKAP